MPRTLLVPFLLTGCYDLTSPESTPDETWTLPANSWPATEGPPADLEEQGFDVGQVVPDVRLPDQFGAEVSLWQFYGNVIVLDVSTIWCLPCQALAEGTQETQDTYDDQDFTYVTVLQEDAYFEPPDTEDLNVWVDAFALSTPVLADGDKTGASVIDPTEPSWPVVLVIDREMKVHDKVDPPDDATLRAAVEEVL
jgi:thiol-disulfide isomerase/thioredoxin